MIILVSLGNLNTRYAQVDRRIDNSVPLFLSGLIGMFDFQ